MCRLAAIVVVLLMAAPTVATAQEPAAKESTRPAATKKERERRAQAAFVAGRYQEAAELLNGLYAEFRNPVYLRNLGRCYQRLNDPDRAIAAFDEYLRRDKSVTPAEREEVQGFIREMEELKNKAAAPPPPPPPPAVTAAPTPAAPVAAVPPVAPPSVAAPPAAVTPSSVPTVATTPEKPRTGSGRLIGGVLLGAAALLGAGGGVMLASSWSEHRRGKSFGCPGLYDCAKYAERIEGRSMWAKILFGAAAVTGIAGGTVLVLNLSPGSSGPSAAGTGMSVALEGKF